MDNRTIDEIRKNETVLINELKQKEDIINKANEKLELLLSDLKFNCEKEKEEGKSYFNTQLFAIRAKEIKNILDNKGE